MVNKRPKEQVAFHSYKNYVSAGSRPGNSSASLDDSDRIKAKREAQSSLIAASSPHRRVVRTPENVVEPKPWADRRAQYRSFNTGPQAKSKLMPRTLAQTGVPAVSGPVRRLPPMRHRTPSTPIPVRSGSRRPRFIAGTADLSAPVRFLRRLLAMLAVLVILVLGGSFALTGSAFRVQQLNIVGTQNSALVGSIEHMGIQGQNIFLLNTAALVNRIEAIPLVASADLAKQLPNSITITVAERTPALLWQTSQSTYSVDRYGKVIAPASQTAGADHLLTVVDMRKGSGQQLIHPGDSLNTADIAFATQVFTRLPQLTGISNFTLRYMPANVNKGSYVVASSDGWLAYLGNANDSNPLDNRLLELQQILTMARQQQLHLATIDLRFGLRPVYTLKS